jgi:outer membrane biosynthesis protein TonB
MSKKISMERLQEVIKDFNNLQPPFDPLLSEEGTEEELLEDIIGNANELKTTDPLTTETKKVLIELGVGPWLDIEGEPEPEPVKEEPKSEPVKKVPAKKVAAKKTSKPKVVTKKEVKKTVKKQKAVVQKVPMYTQIMAIVDVLSKEYCAKADIVKKVTGIYEKKTTKKANPLYIERTSGFLISAFKHLGMIKTNATTGKILISKD